METKVHPEVLDHMIHHLDLIGDVPKITLLLYTKGGDTLAAWSIVNLIRQFCKHLEVLVPEKALSAGTLMCLGANSVMMTKQATIGPIDPSVITPLNPTIGAGPAQQPIPVSVENINGFIEYARSVSDREADLIEVFAKLADSVHPMVLGTAYRARTQIRMLASKLLTNAGVVAAERHKAVLDFLCSESGSHDYTINRREAREALGLPVEKPNDQQYKLIKSTFDSIRDEMLLTSPYDPRVAISAEPSGEYRCIRALVESLPGGSHQYVSGGTLRQQQVMVGPGSMQLAIQDNRTQEGWIHVSV